MVANHVMLPRVASSIRQLSSVVFIAYPTLTLSAAPRESKMSAGHVAYVFHLSAYTRRRRKGVDVKM